MGCLFRLFAEKVSWVSSFACAKGCLFLMSVLLVIVRLDESVVFFRLFAEKGVQGVFFCLRKRLSFFSCGKCRNGSEHATSGMEARPKPKDNNDTHDTSDRVRGRKTPFYLKTNGRSPDPNQKTTMTPPTPPTAPAGGRHHFTTD